MQTGSDYQWTSFIHPIPNFSFQRNTILYELREHVLKQCLWVLYASCMVQGLRSPRRSRDHLCGPIGYLGWFPWPRCSWLPVFFLIMSHLLCKIHVGQYLLRKAFLEFFFPREVNNASICLTSVSCVHICVIM